MTDLALTGADAPAAKPKRRRMLMLALPLLTAGAGAASTYFGYWSPLALVGMGTAEASHAPEKSVVAFVDLPPINVTLPGPQPRMLHLAIKLETDEAAREALEHLLPRVSDAFNTFLTGVAPQAFDRRGILEVIRDELTARARTAVGKDIPVSVLVTEFALK